MTCADVTTLLNAFSDAELPTPMMLAVARHAGGCTVCDEAVRRLSALHDAVTAAVEAEVDALDFSGVWPAVVAEADAVDARRQWRARLRVLPAALAAAGAVAAGALVWYRGASPEPVPRPARVASARTLPNQAFIDRLAGKDVRLQRDSRSGTTIIWVNAASGVGQ
jgi:anti-sigma factor RsiW